MKVPMGGLMGVRAIVVVLAALLALVGGLTAVLFSVFVLTFPFENRSPHPNPRNEWALWVAAVGLLPTLSLLVGLLLGRRGLAGASLATALVAYAAWALLLYGFDGSIEF